MSESSVMFADRLEAAGRQLVQAGEQLKRGELSADALHELSKLLAALAEVVYLYADKLGSPAGLHALREPPDEPPPAA